MRCELSESLSIGKQTARLVPAQVDQLVHRVDKRAQTTFALVVRSDALDDDEMAWVDAQLVVAAMARHLGGCGQLLKAAPCGQDVRFDLGLGVALRHRRITVLRRALPNPATKNKGARPSCCRAPRRSSCARPTAQ